MNNRRILLTIMVLLTALTAVNAQDLTAEAAEAQEAIPDDPVGATDAVLAISSGDYPVTPGDVYRLVYVTPAGQVDTTTVLQSDFTVGLGAAGRIDANGLTYPALRQQIINTIKEAYPQSLPDCTLVSLGRFFVHVKGAVRAGPRVVATGMARLSDLVDRVARSDATTRGVEISRSVAGRTSTRSYDVFAATREGLHSQDPFLRPGDLVSFSQATKRIRLEGEVVLPGAYDLVPGDDLDTVLHRYGAGLTPDAHAGRVVVVRRDEATVDKRSIVVDRGDPPTGFALRHRDEIHVPSVHEFMPSLNVQGALRSPDGQLWHRFVPGETLGDALRQIADSISPAADLRSSVLFRASRPGGVSVDAAQLLYNPTSTRDIELLPGDRLVIPQGGVRVVLRGEVARTGPIWASPGARLLDVLSDRVASGASLRTVSVQHPAGETRRYDLFAADRLGELQQNPLVEPGMIVEVGLAHRTARIDGEVRRPGTYELLPSDGFRELVSTFAGGPTLDADLHSVRLVRTDSRSRFGVETRILTWSELEALEPLDGDHITLVAESTELPVVLLEGAVGSGQVYNTVEYKLTPGDTVRALVRRNRGQIRDDAALERATLIRADGQTLPLDLASVLRDVNSAAQPVELLPGDRIHVPLRRNVVIVSGAVARPAEYPYVPNRDWQYYTALAGGINTDAHWGNNPRLIGPTGESLDPGTTVQPETTIHVPVNNPITKYLVPVTTVVSAVTAIINLYRLLAP